MNNYWNKRKIALAFFIVLGKSAAIAQVKIGDTGTPNPAALLELSSPTGAGAGLGLLSPKANLGANTCAWGLAGSPVSGMSVYNTNAAMTGTAAYPVHPGVTGLYYWDSAGWVAMGAGKFIANGTPKNADNGLTVGYNADGNVGLGGSLSKNTAIDLKTNTLTLTTSTGGLKLAATTAGTTAFNMSATGIFGIDRSDMPNGRFSVLENGNVGVGDPNPSYKFQVNGPNIGVVNTLQKSYFEASNGFSNVRLQNTNGPGYVGTMQSYDFQIYSNGAARITAQAGGNIGVGTSSPGNKLEVNQGTTGNSGLRFTQLNSTTASVAGVATLGVNADGDVVVAGNAGSGLSYLGRVFVGDVCACSGNGSITASNQITTATRNSGTSAASRDYADVTISFASIGTSNYTTIVTPVTTTNSGTDALTNTTITDPVVYNKTATGFNFVVSETAVATQSALAFDVFIVK